MLNERLVICCELLIKLHAIVGRDCTSFERLLTCVPLLPMPAPVLAFCFTAQSTDLFYMARICVSLLCSWAGHHHWFSLIHWIFHLCSTALLLVQGVSFSHIAPLASQLEYLSVVLAQTVCGLERVFYVLFQSLGHLYKFNLQLITKRLNSATLLCGTVPQCCGIAPQWWV